MGNYYRHFPIESFKFYVAGKKHINKINSQILKFQKLICSYRRKEPIILICKTFLKTI